MRSSPFSFHPSLERVSTCIYTDVATVSSLDLNCFWKDGRTEGKQSTNYCIYEKQKQTTLTAFEEPLGILSSNRSFKAEVFSKFTVLTVPH